MSDERQEEQAPQGFWSTPELAAYLSCTEHAIRTWVANGTIPYHKVGRLVRFRKEEIDAWVKPSGEAVA